MSVVLAASTDLIAPTFALAGAVAGAAIAASVSVLNARSQSKRDSVAAAALVAEQRRLALTERASDFLASTFHATLSLRDLAMATSADKRSVEKETVWPTVDRVNRCLLAIEINDDASLVAAALALDAALRDLARQAKSEQFAGEDWTALRDAVIGDLPAEFKRAARSLADRLQSAQTD